VSGLSGSTEVAQSQVSVGMGLLAGSTVLLLTIIWGTCVIVGKCDIEDSIALDSTDTRGFHLTRMSFHIVHSLNFKFFESYCNKLISALAFRLQCFLFSSCDHPSNQLCSRLFICETAIML